MKKKPSLRKIANNDGFKTYENIERLNETKKLKIFDIIFLAVKPQQMEETVKSFYKFNLINQFLFLLQLDYLFLGLGIK